MTGKQSVDGNSGMVGPGVACKLGIPYVSNVIKIEDVSGDSATVRRMLDEGVQTVKVSLPACFAVSIEINEPRVPELHGHPQSLPNAVPGRKCSRFAGPGEGQGRCRCGPDQMDRSAKPPKRGGQCEFIQAATAGEQAAVLTDKLIADKVL